MTILDQLNEIEKRCEKATPGPWNAYDWPEFPRRDEYKSCVRIESETTITAFCFDGKPNHDALFISNSRTDIPKLIEVVKVLSAALEKIKNESQDMADYSIEDAWFNAAKEALTQAEEILKK